MENKELSLERKASHGLAYNECFQKRGCFIEVEEGIVGCVWRRASILK